MKLFPYLPRRMRFISLRSSVRFVGDRFLEGKSDLQHGRDDRRGHAVPGYIGDENADAVVVEDMEIVEIAAHLVHRKVPGVVAEILHDGRPVGKDRLQNAFRDLQLLLHDDEGIVLFDRLPEREQGVDARDELALVKGLGEVIVRPCLEPGYDVVQLVLGGQHEDRELVQAVGLAETAADFKARHARHHDVEHQQVGRILGDTLDGVLAVRRDHHAVPLQQQLVGEHLEVDRLVVDDEDPGSSFACLRGKRRKVRMAMPGLHRALAVVRGDGRLVLRNGDREDEARSFSLLGLDPDLAVVELDQLFRDGEAQPGAAVFARYGGVHLLERPEDVTLPVAGYPDAGVLDAHLHHGGGRRPGPGGRP